jgi:hypothetical protein
MPHFEAIAAQLSPDWTVFIRHPALEDRESAICDVEDSVGGDGPEAWILLAVVFPDLMEDSIGDVKWVLAVKLVLCSKSRHSALDQDSKADWMFLKVPLLRAMNPKTC